MEVRPSDPPVLSLPQCAAWSAGPGGLAGLRGSPQVVTCGLQMQSSKGLLPASHHNRTGLVLSLYLMPTHFTGGHKCPPASPQSSFGEGLWGRRHKDKACEWEVGGTPHLGFCRAERIEGGIDMPERGRWQLSFGHCVYGEHGRKPLATSPRLRPCLQTQMAPALSSL